MKRLFICVLLCGSTALVNAQGAKVLNAYNYMNDNELLKAKAEIEPATEHVKSKEDAKTWYYRGMIYENIYKNSFAKDEKTGDVLFPELEAAREGAVLTSIESYEKAISIGSKKINMAEVKQHHAEMSKWAYQEGVNYYNQKNYVKAADMFGKCYEVKMAYEMVDNEAAYNAGLAYKLAGEKAKAEEYLRLCIQNEFKAEQVYLDLFYMYGQDEADSEKYKATLSEAREKFPENKDIIQEEINIYLGAKEYDKALSNLDKAIELDPTNQQLLYARGIILDNQQATLRGEGKTDEANAAYKRAESDYKSVVDLDPEGFDGNYSIGALYYNRGAEMLNEANNILDDAKYKTAKLEAETELKAALPFLEKAHALDPTDMQTMISLKVIYARANQMGKFDEMKEKLEN